MNITTAIRSRGRAELTCLYCGHALGEVSVPRGRRPTNAELRAAYGAAPDATQPAWDAHGAPRCPRCAARLFIELSDRHLRAHAGERMSRRHADAQTAEEREDAYEREDVYVSAAETRD
jgi:hypothetical protein